MDNIEKIRQYIKEHDSEAFLISNQTNEFYISGFKGKGYLVIDEENQYLLTTTDYQEQAKLETSGFKLVDLEEQSLSDFLTKYKNIIIESINLSAYEYQKLSIKIFP
jgi:Xaa-Pro aminopeptidase